MSPQSLKCWNLCCRWNSRTLLWTTTAQTQLLPLSKSETRTSTRPSLNGSWRSALCSPRSRMPRRNPAPIPPSCSVSRLATRRLLLPSSLWDAKTATCLVCIGIPVVDILTRGLWPQIIPLALSLHVIIKSKYLKKHVWCKTYLTTIVIICRPVCK